MRYSLCYGALPVSSVPPPATLQQHYDLGALRAEEGMIVALDHDDRISWVNDAWLRFASENGGDGVLARHGTGTRYIDGICGPLADYFAKAFATVRGSGEPWVFEYECSSAMTFRLHRMRVLPIGEAGLLVEHSAVDTRPHDRVAEAPEASEYRDAAGLLVQCSNCRKVRRVGDGWRWIPAWVSSPPAPPVSHGLCAPCEGLFIESARKQRMARRGGAK